MNRLKLLALLVCSMAGSLHADDFDIGDSRVFGGTVIATWTRQDLTGESRTFGAFGNFVDPPTSWTVQDITADNPSSILSTPFLCSNTNGDVVAIWTYYDNLLKTIRVASARLPQGALTWTVDILSDNNPLETVQQGHVKAQISDTGNIIVEWTSYNYTTQSFVLRIVNGTISGLLWTLPTQLGGP